jgi:hypothetical protein
VNAAHFAGNPICDFKKAVAYNTLARKAIEGADQVLGSKEQLLLSDLEHLDSLTNFAKWPILLFL